MKIAILPGDGIGPEIVAQAVKVLNVLGESFELETAPVGGAGYAAHGHPLPEGTLALAKAADAVLFGAVGDYQYDNLERQFRPEQAILGLRKNLGLFANLRPAILYPELAGASTLKPEVVSGLDILIIRELTGDIYFGQPRGVRECPDGPFKGQREGFDTMRYAEGEIRRIAHVAFQAAQKRDKRLTSVDKANVLETFQFWKDIVTDVHKEYPDVALDHMYVDNAAMQLVRAPKKFDVMVTGNMFGDILSDAAAMLTGSIWAKSPSSCMRCIRTEPTIPRQPTKPTNFITIPQDETATAVIRLFYPSAFTTASPIASVPTKVVPASWISAVRKPCANTFLTAASMRFACSSRFSE